MKSHKETDTRTFSRTNVYRHDRSKTTDPEPSGIFTVPDAPCPDRIRLTAHSAEYSQYTAPPKSSHRLHGKSSCIEACQPRVSAVSAAVFVRSQSTGRPHAASTASRYSAIGVNPAAARSEPRRAASSTGQSRKAPPPIRIRCKRLRAVVLRQFVMHPHAIERRCIIRHFDRTFRRSLFDHRQIAFNIHRRSIAESPAGLLRSPPRKSGRPSARTEHSENEPSIHAVALLLADDCQRQRVRGNRQPAVQTHDLLADFPIRRTYRTKQRIELRTLRPCRVLSRSP